MDELFISQLPYTPSEITAVAQNTKKYFANYKLSVVETDYVAPRKAVERILPTMFRMLPNYTSLSFIVKPRAMENVSADILYFAELLIGKNNLTIGMDRMGIPTISAYNIKQVIRPMSDRGYFSFSLTE
jgi:hypothetical protein